MSFSLTGYVYFVNMMAPFLDSLILNTKSVMILFAEIEGDFLGRLFIFSYKHNNCITILSTALFVYRDTEQCLTCVVCERACDPWQ